MLFHEYSPLKCQMCANERTYRILPIRHHGYSSMVAFFLWKAHRHQQWLDKVHKTDTVTTVRHCQKHSLSVLLLAVEMSHTTQTALHLYFWKPQWKEN